MVKERKAGSIFRKLGKEIKKDMGKTEFARTYKIAKKPLTDAQIRANIKKKRKKRKQVKMQSLVFGDSVLG